MRPYVTITGVLFLLVVLAHIARLTQEPDQLRNPWFLGISVLALALAVWAWRLLRFTSRGS